MGNLAPAINRQRFQFSVFSFQLIHSTFVTEDHEVPIYLPGIANDDNWGGTAINLKKQLLLLVLIACRLGGTHYSSFLAGVYWLGYKMSPTNAI
jgi:hypothetical protein